MSAAIDFYFDFGSPYAYCAAARAEEIAAAHGRALVWRPVLLWACRERFGMPAPFRDGPEAEYMRRDFERSAAYHGLPFVWPPSFSRSTHAAARLFYGIEARDAGQARAFARRALDAHFGEGVDLTDPERLAALAAGVGVSPEAAARFGTSGEVRAKLRQVNEDAIAAGVWGSPFFVLDGEPFFGADRLPQMDWRLAQVRTQPGKKQ